MITSLIKIMKQEKITMIDVTLLGTSALMPLPNRALTSAFLSCEGHSILFDCGEGTQTAARKSGISLMKTDIFAITHYHGDHFFGLPGLLQTMMCLNRTTKLYITGPEGLNEALEPILKLAGYMTFDIELIAIPDEGLMLAELIHGWPHLAKLSAFRTEHRILSQGYCFELGRAGKFMPDKARELNIPVNLWGHLQKGSNVVVGDEVIVPEQVLGNERKGLKFVFTGDTAECDSLTEAARDSDLLICEATYGENEQRQLAIDHGHMNFSQAADTAKNAGVKRLWLTHYSPMIDDPMKYLHNAQNIFPDAICGHDGMNITLTFED